MDMEKGSNIFKKAIVRIVMLPVMCVVGAVVLTFMVASLPVIVLTMVSEWVLSGHVKYADDMVDFVFDTVPSKFIDFFDRITE